MKRIIPFLYIGIIACGIGMFILYVHRSRDRVVGDVSAVSSTAEGDVMTEEYVSSQNNEATTEAGLQLSSTTKSEDKLGGSVLVNANQTVDSTTVVPSSTGNLVRVQPGFGGGASVMRSSLLQLPEYKEEQSKVEPVIEFEYCD